MILEALRLSLALLLLVALPGWLLVQALFPSPRSRLRVSERLYLSLAGGVLLLMLVGIVLGFLPHGDHGHLQTLASGLPNVELAMFAASGGLFLLGARRGAYPRLVARYPRLLAPWGASAQADEASGGPAALKDFRP